MRKSYGKRAPLCVAPVDLEFALTAFWFISIAVAISTID